MNIYFFIIIIIILLLLIIHCKKKEYYKKYDYEDLQNDVDIIFLNKFLSNNNLSERLDVSIFKNL